VRPLQPIVLISDFWETFDQICVAQPLRARCRRRRNQVRDTAKSLWLLTNAKVDTQKNRNNFVRYGPSYLSPYSSRSPFTSIHNLIYRSFTCLSATFRIKVRSVGEKIHESSTLFPRDISEDWTTSFISVWNLFHSKLWGSIQSVCSIPICNSRLHRWSRIYRKTQLIQRARSLLENAPAATPKYQLSKN
jgi:hypothetical protein